MPAEYWIPGRRDTTPSFPIPQNGSSVNLTAASLIFRPARDCASHDVYAGVSVAAVQAKLAGGVADAQLVSGNNVFDVPPTLFQVGGVHWLVTSDCTRLATCLTHV